MDRRGWSRRGRRAAAALAAVAMSASTAAGDRDLLLVPNRTTSSVWAFSPIDGALVTDRLVPADGRMIDPREALASGLGTVLVSDQTADAVFEYTAEGAYVRTVADATTHGLDNVRGIAVRGGDVYVCMLGEPTNPLRNTVQRVNLETGAQHTWATLRLSSPQDIVFRSTDALVTNSATNTIERYSFTGGWFGTFAASDGVTGFDLPIQITLMPNGDVLVGSVITPRGVHRFDRFGFTVAFYDAEASGGAGIRAVWPLDDGRFLYTSNNETLGLGVFDPNAGTFSPLVNDGGFEGIARVQLPSPECPCDFDDSGVRDLNDYFAYLGAFLAQLDVADPRAGTADFDEDGVVTLNDYFAYLACLPSLADQMPCP